MTNGDMIRALFPEGKIIRTNNFEIGLRFKGDNWIIWFKDRWWNSPYTKEAEDEDIVHCINCTYRDPENKRCDCGRLQRAGCIFPVSDDYYCAYGKEKNNDQMHSMQSAH